jgi:hypothetical protein
MSAPDAASHAPARRRDPRINKNPATDKNNASNSGLVDIPATTLNIVVINPPA